MARGALVTFIAALAYLGYVYIGYPCLLWFLGRLLPFVHHPRGDCFPAVSVLIAAHNEEKDIAAKIAETFAWDWPADRLEVLVASDDSSDSTDEILRGIHDPRLRVVRIEPRAGKNEALNRLAALARGELFFFTDANTRVPPSCLRSLARHFADPRVGCVTGVEQTTETSQSAIAPGSRLHLGYEAMIDALESRLGAVLVCDGSVFCILGRLYHRLEPDLANDVELPVCIGAQGWAVLFEPEARSSESVTCSLREEFDRRRRICGFGALAAWRLRGNLRGRRGWQFLSRKVLRWFGAIPLALLLVSAALMARQPFFAAILLLQLAAYALAGIGAWRCARGKPVPLWQALPLYVALGHIGAFIGMVQTLFGRRFSAWEIPALSRGRGEVT